MRICVATIAKGRTSLVKVERPMPNELPANSIGECVRMAIAKYYEKGGSYFVGMEVKVTFYSMKGIEDL